MSLPSIEALVPQAPGTRRYVIVLDGLALDLFLGIHERERAAPQHVLLSVQMVCDYPDRPLGDDIAQVVDYDFLRGELHALAKERRFDLQESLCDAVAEACWAFPPVQGVWVQSTKTDIYPDAAIGCRVLRLRPA